MLAKGGFLMALSRWIMGIMCRGMQFDPMHCVIAFFGANFEWALPAGGHVDRND